MNNRRTIIKENFELNLNYFTEHKKSTIINDELQISYKKNNDWVFLFKNDVTEEIEISLENVLSLNETEPYVDINNTIFAKDMKISTILEENLLEAPFNFIDFKRHLQPPYTLNKIVTKNSDGRPNYSEYFYEDQLIAKIIFVFRNFPNSPLMWKRAEILNYVMNDGSMSPDIFIKSKEFVISSPVDLQTLIAERENARRNIVNGMIGSVSGIMVQSGYANSSGDASVKARPFFDLIEKDKDAFISIGTEDLKDFLLGLDLTKKEYDFMQGGIYGWLSLPLPAPIGSIRNFMASAITYVTSDTHLDKII